MTAISLSRLHYPVRNLGFGVRAGIWFQGCSIRCRGCVSRDTWNFRSDDGCTTDDVLSWLDHLPEPLDGVTVTGGEPTDQPDALRDLLHGIRTWRAGRSKPVDVLLYSGQTATHLASRHRWLREAVDLMISGPFVQERAGGHALRGSDDQLVETYSDLARRRYPAADLEAEYAGQRRVLGVHVDDESIWLVGIPLPGDLARLRGVLSTRGIEVTRTSWSR